MTRSFAVLAYLVALAGAGPARAATPPPSSPSVTADQPNADRSAPGTISSQLSRTDGVLRPPPVDPGMQKTPTRPGTMPVIHPPGTPGGPPGPVAK